MLYLAYTGRDSSTQGTIVVRGTKCGVYNAINNGQLEKGERKPPIKKTYGGGSTASKAPNPMNIPHQCLILYLLLGTSMSIVTSTKNLAIKPTIASALNMKYKIS
ncbi:hypothetical protein SO802_034585 [Lithocarpus litseifolius]|uniref:Uncharacterized protein n=1 Tax=Lithocarpus litseifolius TaxID=425828 RepID=A0AAW2BJJ9_9ROSI